MNFKEKLETNARYGKEVDVSWMSDPQYLAQVGHFLGGASLILLTALFSMAKHVGFEPIGAILGLGMLVAGFKEFWFDIRYEHDSWKNSAMDFAFYVFGGIAGTGLSLLAFSIQ